MSAYILAQRARELLQALALANLSKADADALSWHLFSQADSRFCSRFELEVLLKYLEKIAKTKLAYQFLQKCPPEKTPKAPLRPREALPTIRAVLFDLDGTLADTAHDLGASLNMLRDAHDLPPLPDSELRAVASHGSDAFIKLGFDIPPSHPRFEPLREEFLQIYENHICDKTHLFSGMEQVLNYLQNHEMPWGIVTNKPARFTEPLVAKLFAAYPPGVVISGDTLAKSKPDPAPLIYAAARLNMHPKHCLYIGDAARDIEAGHAAGMHSIVALYGYLDLAEAASWEADTQIVEAQDLLPILDILR